MSDAHTSDARVGVQFENLAKQEHALRFGMWLFLSSELLLFAGLFALYSAYRSTHASEFTAAIHHNALLLGSLNTVVLIVSSFTVVWSIHALRRDRRRTTIAMLVATIGLGSLILVDKAIEYSEHFSEGIYPGRYYAFDGLPSQGAKLFFTLYYFMTGLHAIHMIAGLAVMTWFTTSVIRRTTTVAHHGGLELGALY